MAHLTNFQSTARLEILPSWQSNPVSIPTKKTTQATQHTLTPLPFPTTLTARVCTFFVFKNSSGLPFFYVFSLELFSTGSRNRVVSRLSAHFPVLKWHSRPLAEQLYCKISKNWSEVSWLSWLLVARAAPSMTTVLSFEGRNGEVKPKFKIDFFSAILFDWRYVLLCVTLVVKLTSKSLV